MSDDLGKRVLAAYSAWSSAEGALDSLLWKSGHLGDFSYTVDPYDGSIEVYDPAPIDVTAAGVLLISIGFDRAWIHPHATGVETNGCGPGRCNTSVYFCRSADGVRRIETDGWPGPGVTVSP